MKIIMNIHKKYILLYAAVFVFLLAANVISRENHTFYKTPIVRITAAETKPAGNPASASEGEEILYHQILTGKIMNGANKGSFITLTNAYSSSELLNDAYEKGDEIFVNLNNEEESSLSGIIIGLKRDKYVVAMLSALMMLLVLLEKRKGILTILSLFLNISAFYSALSWYKNSTDILALCILVSVFFVLFSLIFLNGFNKRTFAAVLSTMLSVAVTMLIFIIVMNNSKEIDFAYMDFLIMPKDASKIFLSGVLIGGLGTIMDIAITMASAVNEILRKNPAVSAKALFLSGRIIGDDIMGTMINVLFFTYVCGGIPMILLLLNSNIQISSIISVYMPYEIYRFLIGSIGILLAIPISLAVSILFAKGGPHLCFWR